MCRFLSVIFVLLLVSCSHNSPVNQQLSGSDSLVIRFNTPGSNTIEKTMTSTERTAIKKLGHYIDSKKSEAFTCGYDGNLLFYKEGVVAADVSFNFSVDSCRHFILSVNGELTSTQMSNEAADFLKSLAEGKSWY